ncbi:EAL domain-containing protein [Marinobacter adhaerens]|uniref:cyclic-guanylate-specific phosphodiesterase n=1 Tax=Marinobacter adhaerens TaxID=1033846 RepID=A0A851HP95_9GAMM|nr:EAL domain-containing protein [Marinobacter adhaerens]NWN90717.1 EAL domain-containing protein [Marinobacter adhaerens]
MLKLLTRVQRFRSGFPLSFHFLGWVVLFSSVLTLVVSAILIYTDHQARLTEMDQRLQAIESEYAASLTASLETLDQELLQTQLMGILSLPDIVHLRLNIKPDSELIMGVAPRDARVDSYKLDLPPAGEAPSALGELTVTASLERIYQNTKNRAFTILATQFFITLLVAVLAVWAFQHFVARHLAAMAAYAKDFSLEQTCIPLTLDRRDTALRRTDEIARTADAINQLRERLHKDAARQKQDAAKIRKFSTAIEQSPSSVLICDRQWRIEYANRKFTQLTGYAPESIIGKKPGSHSENEQEIRGSRYLWQGIRLQVQRVGVWQGEVNSIRRNGERFWEQLIVTSMKDDAGHTTGYLILGEDISIRKRYEQQLLRQANYDILTGLPNRMLALDRLKLALAQAQREGSMVAVMFLDLDNFKHINDTLGHDAGDSLLIEAARRISSCLRGTSTVARLGGDEFLVILPGLAGPEASAQVAERILESFTPAYSLSDQEVFVTTSIGIAVYPADSDNSGALLQHADAAMYQAKRQGKSSYAHFTPEMHEQSHERLQMESRLRRALELEEFELHFQPILETATGQLRTVEALLRWNNPVMGMTLPDRFIPLAEETGLIIPIGEWVFEEACRAANRWKLLTGRDIDISVNVSPRQFRDPRFTGSVKAALSRNDLAPERLELEITERLLLDNSIETADILRQLDREGVRLAVDDFGTGYSALSYLKGYPFDTLKIDKSFIHDVTQEQEAGALVRAIINMAHSLGLTITAEGVDDALQAEFLKKEGCDLAQGYFYSVPLPDRDFTEWLKIHYLD